MQDLEKKITRVEYDIESHSSRILSLETAFKELNSSLSDIQNLLLQIAVGALLVMAFTDDTLGKQLMKLLT